MIFTGATMTITLGIILAATAVLAPLDSGPSVLTERAASSTNMLVAGLPSVELTGEVIFRHQKRRKRGILKLEGELGHKVYWDMREPVGVRCKCRSDKCKRMGVNVVASTQNIRDPVVAEFRFSPGGELVSRTDDFKLYHSLAGNRRRGQGYLEDGRLRITGDAAAGLIEFWNFERRASGEAPLRAREVVLWIVDAKTGEWELDTSLGLE